MENSSNLLNHQNDVIYFKYDGENMNIQNKSKIYK